MSRFVWPLLCTSFPPPSFSEFFGVLIEEFFGRDVINFAVATKCRSCSADRDTGVVRQLGDREFCAARAR